MYKVYIHTLPNNKRYIGITFREPTKRWKNGNGYCNNRFFYNAIKKYGWENIRHEVLFDNLTKEEAEQKEIELISFYNSANRNYGYNLSMGGESHPLVSNQTRERLRKSHIGKAHRPQTKEEKKHISKIMKEKWKDKKFKEKLMKRLIEKHAVKVLCIETNEVFNSYVEASINKNISPKHIGECCKGTRKTTGGYHWKKVGGDYA